MMRRGILALSIFGIVLAACQDAPLKPGPNVPTDANLSVGGVPGPPPFVVPPAPPGPPPRVRPRIPGHAGPPSFLSDIIDIGAGSQFACALRSDGVAYCWGANGSGQLGDGSVAASASPVEVSGPTRFVRIFVGDLNVCGLTATGAAWCWGDNSLGQLGNGQVASSPIPVAVAGGLTFRQLSVGLRTTCGIANDGLTYCWGSNLNGLLATGTLGGSSNVPVAIPGSGTLGFTSVSVSFLHACALNGTGAVYCWGQTSLFGNGTTTPARVLTPSPAASGTTLAQVDAGNFYTCGLSAAGTASCWGTPNTSGEVGNGSPATPVLVPTAVVAAPSFESVDAFHSNSVLETTCGVTPAGQVWCWGANGAGQLGGPSAGSCTFQTQTYPCSATPVQVAGSNTYQAVAVGREHACAIDAAGGAWCWGSNSMGALGDGTLVNSSTPVQVIGLEAPQQAGYIVVTPAAPLLRFLGVTQALTAQALDENGVPLATQPTFTWTSSDPGVAPVNASGVVTALVTGSTVVTATAPNGQSGRAAVGVNIIDPALAFQQSWVGGGGGSDGVVLTGGLLADEFYHSGTFLTRREVDLRTVTTGNATLAATYAQLDLARRALEFEAARLQSVSPSDPKLGQMLTLAGYVYLAFAENFCSGVPLDDPNVGLTTVDLLTRAATRFTQALGGPIAAPHTEVARVGTARAQLGLGNHQAAAQAAALVPSGFAFTTTHSNIIGQENFIYLNNTSTRRFSVADNEGTNGLPFRSASDPRVQSSPGGVGFDGVTPSFLLLKYPSVGSPVTVASATEARLIEAEAVLQGGNVAGFLAGLNALRGTAGLAPVIDPGTSTGRVNLLFAERAFWLYATGTRLGDVRRLIGQYGRTEGAVLPIGTNYSGQPYGTDANLPVPASARGPAFAGCTNRTS